MRTPVSGRDGRPIDEETLERIRKTAEQGVVFAQRNWGAMYLQRNGATHNYEEAAKWFLKAAGQGDTHSQRTLGAIHATGSGVTKDHIQAYMSLTLSIARSTDKQSQVLQKATELRDSLAKNMTTQQIEEAQSLASKWKPLLRSISQQKIKPTFGMKAELVNLPVVVTTQKGKRITNLNEEDFRIYEDDVEQEISYFAAPHEPTAVALFLDTSGSTQNMQGIIRNAAEDFVNQLHPEDKVGIFTFAMAIRLRQDFSTDRNRIEDVINNISSGGTSRIYDAVWAGLEQGFKSITKRKKALVILTDGVDTFSQVVSMEKTLEAAKETQATIYCVYYNTIVAQFGTMTLPPEFRGSRPDLIAAYAAGREYLDKLSEYSGGVVFDGSTDLQRAFGEVAKDLASQYRIGYYSIDSKPDGKLRKVEIRMVQPDLTARTKSVITSRKVDSQTAHPY